MSKWIKWLILAVLLGVMATLSVTVALQSRHLRTLKSTNQQQRVIIDSLLTLDRTSVEIQLFVTDRSVNKIYGRYNKGTIQMPTLKTYVLEYDSATTRVIKSPRTQTKTQTKTIGH